MNTVETPAWGRTAGFTYATEGYPEASGRQDFFVEPADRLEAPQSV